jgi:hypothetical protein
MRKIIYSQEHREYLPSIHYIVRPMHVVTSINQSSVLKGHIFIDMS